jgi:hypothetical protein
LYLLLGSRIEGRRSRFAAIQEAIVDRVMESILREWHGLR